MLIRFEASNYRSIDEPVELSMVAVDRDRPEARDQPMIDQSLLPIAAIFGPNASGKSNVIAAFAWLREAVATSLFAWEDSIPVEPFAFSGNKNNITCFSIEYMIDGIRFEYNLELNSEKVLHEALYHYPKKRPKGIFERNELDFKIQRGLGSISGTRELLTNRSLALSAARRFDEPLINQFARNLLNTQILGQTPHYNRNTRFLFGRRRSPNRRSTVQIFGDVPQPSLFDNDTDEADGNEIMRSDREQALGLLRLADLGIDDVVVDREEVQGTSGDTSLVQTIHLIHKTKDGHAPLELAMESEGTRTWFRLIGPVLGALRTGTLLLFDELDASLHPTLSAQVIKLFQSPTTNPNGAQLVFTSHDTSLLNHLNRDEVWLTNKTPSGSTRLGALAEFAGERVRKSQNLESAYLHGRFGALPQVDQSDFLRAIGLIG